MAAKDRTTFVIDLDARKADSELRAFRVSLNGIATAAAGMATAGVAAFAAIGAASLKSYKAQIDAETKLEAAIRASGKAIDSQKIKDYASALQSMTTYGDEATVGAAAMLTTFDLTEKQIMSLLPRVQNLSAMFGLDLNTAAIVVGKAMTNGVGVLSRYGITLTEADKAAFKFADQNGKVAILMRTIDTNAGDAAVQLAQVSGGYAQMANAADDFLEEIGKIIHSDLNSWFADLAETISFATSEFIAFVDVFRDSAAFDRAAAVIDKVSPDISKKATAQQNTRRVLEKLQGAESERRFGEIVRTELGGSKFVGMSREAVLQGLQELVDDYAKEIAELRGTIQESMQKATTKAIGGNSGGGGGGGKKKKAAKEKPLVSSTSGIFDPDLAAIGIADPKIAALLQAERNQIEANATAERDAMAKASAEYQIELLATINDEHLKSDDAVNAARDKANEERRKKELDAEKQLAAETLALRKQYTDEALSYTSQLISSVFGSFLDSVEKVAAGEKVAFAEIASAFLMEQGKQIFGIGLKYAVEGAGMIAASGGMSPAGYATLAAGVAGMAVGGAMATSGAVVAGSARAATSAASGGGGTSRGGIGTRGPSSRHGGGSSTVDGGGITIVYNGGVHMGNTADFTSTLSRESRRADREVFASRRVA